MKQLAIIGASYLQAPLIQKAKELGCETHVFAWAADDVGEKIADLSTPSALLKRSRSCKNAGRSASTASAPSPATWRRSRSTMWPNRWGLPGNGMRCCEKSTNKHKMREAFRAAGDPSPRSVLVGPNTDLSALEGMQYPLIVKPTDRSGSPRHHRGAPSGRTACRHRPRPGTEL